MEVLYLNKKYFSSNYIYNIKMSIFIIYSLIFKFLNYVPLYPYKMQVLSFESIFKRYQYNDQ